MSVLVCQLHHELGTRGKQWAFPEGGKTTEDLYFPSYFPRPVPKPPTTYYLHIVLECSLIVEKLWQNPHIPLMQKAARLGRLPLH